MTRTIAMLLVGLFVLGLVLVLMGLRVKDDRTAELVLVMILLLVAVMVCLGGLWLFNVFVF